MEIPEDQNISQDNGLGQEQSFIEVPPPPPPPPTTALVAHPIAPPGVVYQLGDIGVTSDMIITPNGEAPLAGSTWVVSDQSRTEEKMPAYAIVLAILLFALCFIGLFFLLIKEKKTTGYVEVRVQSGNLMHMTQVPVGEPAHVQNIRAQVGNIQSLAQRA